MNRPAKANSARNRARAARVPRDDRDLIAAFQAGSETALRELFERHRDRLAQLAGWLCDDERTAEELVRRSLVCCFARSQRRRPTVSFRVEVERALVTRVRRFDRVRRALIPFGLRPRLRVRRVLPLWSLPPTPPPPGDVPADRAVRRALQELPHALREVTVLCDLLGMTYEEAALVAGASPRRIGIRLGRARIRYSAACQRFLRG